VVGIHSGGEYTDMTASPPSLMRAVTIDAHGGVDRLTLRSDLPRPTPAAGEVRLRVLAVSLNRLDLWVLGGIPGVTLRPPWIVGADLSGIVDAVGHGVDGLTAGDRVMVNPGWVDAAGADGLDEPTSPGYGILGEHRPGSLAESVCVPARCCRVVPAALDAAAVAAASLVGLTAWRMVMSRARVQPDDDVLIWGIGGGVSLAALSLCKAIGARVWVTSSSEDKLAKARALGADECLNHAAVDVARTIRQATGKRGVSVVIDSVGTATWKASLGALGRLGRLVTCGGTSGAMVETDVRRMFWNQWTLMGSTMGNQEEFTEVARALVDGRLRVPVDREFPLAETAAAYAYLASGVQFGKVVVRVADA
jgi:NADPH:quinone reductase-like Zn-dependent oxidoreductase